MAEGKEVVQLTQVVVDKFIRATQVESKMKVRFNARYVVAYYPEVNLDDPHHIPTATIVHVNGQGVFKIKESAEEIDAQLEDSGVIATPPLPLGGPRGVV